MPRDASPPNPTVRIGLLAAVGVGLLLAGGGLGYGLSGCGAFLWRPTTSSLSPDDARRVWLIDFASGQMLDRNFHIRLEDMRGDRVRTVFRSPDEGRPIGSERFVWSADSTRFLLLSRHLFVAEEARLPTGEQAYLMMDVRDGRIWCNATQQDRYPSFGVRDLRAIEWSGWSPDPRP